MQRQNIVQRPNDPYIYLFVMGEWYCYNPADEPLGSGAMGTVYLGYRCKNRWMQLSLDCSFSNTSETSFFMIIYLFI